jgi:hypothetical protein
MNMCLEIFLLGSAFYKLEKYYIIPEGISQTSVIPHMYFKKKIKLSKKSVQF